MAAGDFFSIHIYTEIHGSICIPDTTWYNNVEIKFNETEINVARRPVTCL